ncbi:MAG: HAD family hydrolase [Candidatus Nanohaloarchaea archaeon]
MGNMKYDAVIFDKDGVLLDSALNNFLWMDKVRMNEAQKMGLDFTIDDSRRVVHAENVTQIEKFLYQKDMSWDQLEEIERRVQNRKERMIDSGNIRLFPQVKNVLDNLKVPKALVTNAPWSTTEFTLNHFELQPYFRDVQAPRMSPIKGYFSQKKPQPDMIQNAIRKIDAENPVMVGDTSTDVRAAKNAGIDAIQVTAYGNDRVHSADHIIKELSELKVYLN